MKLFKLLCKLGFHKWSDWYSNSTEFKIPQIAHIRYCLKCNKYEFTFVYKDE